MEVENENDKLGKFQIFGGFVFREEWLCQFKIKSYNIHNCLTTGMLKSFYIICIREYHIAENFCQAK